MDKAVEWLKRAPFEEGVEVEIRPLHQASDFGENLNTELRERDQRSREQLAGKKLNIFELQSSSAGSQF